MRAVITDIFWLATSHSDGAPGHFGAHIGGPERAKVPPGVEDVQNVAPLSSLFIRKRQRTSHGAIQDQTRPDQKRVISIDGNLRRPFNLPGVRTFGQ